jgi:mRNA-degrading endonuclease RelE of RelBE toxin-antitoxin system
VRDRLFAFTESLVFTEELYEIAGDETLFAIQNILLENPLIGDVIPGTSGARKARVSNPARGKGKRGGFRFIYVYLERNERIYLIDIYSKHERIDLTPTQARELGTVVREIKKAYGEK